MSHHHGGCVSGAQLGVFLGPQHNVVTACAWRLGFQGWLAVSPRQGVRFVSGSCSVSLRWWAHATSVRVPVGTARSGVRGRSSLHFRAISPSCTTRIPTKDCHMVFHWIGRSCACIEKRPRNVEFRCRVPQAARKACAAAGAPYRDSLHAAGHALLNVMPLFMTCNPSDIRTECENPYAVRYRPERLLLYDSHPGGLGLAAKVCSAAVRSSYMILACDRFPRSVRYAVAMLACFISHLWSSPLA